MHRCFQRQPHEVFHKKGVLKNFAKSTGAHLCFILFLIKLLAFSGKHWCFPGNFAKIFKNTFFTEHLRVTASIFQTLSIGESKHFYWNFESQSLIKKCQANLKIQLTHIYPLLHFYIPWKLQKTVFLTFSGGIEMVNWALWVNNMLAEFPRKGMHNPSTSFL